MRSHLFVAAFAAALTWQATGIEAQTEREITAARLQAIDFLKSRQQTDGSWEYEKHNPGITALCTLALLENGLPIYDPVIDRGYRFVRRNADELEQTYDITLAILLLSRIGDRNDRSLIRTLGARLLAGQRTSGGWTYKCPLAGSAILSDLRRYLKPKEGFGDNSCTQFAVLGLWAASRHGVPIEDAMELVAKRFVETQNPDGGWPYKSTAAAAPRADPDGAAPNRAASNSKHSMTCAGLFCLTVARASRLRAELEKRDDVSARVVQGETETLLEDPTYAKGLARAASYIAAIRPGSPRYFIWSAERLGVLLAREKIGDADWFELGATALLKAQREDGSWPDAHGGLADTSFAILFLRKANLGSDISRMLQGEPGRPFLIAGRAGEPRFDTFQDALEAAEPGDVIQIDGNGPFKLIHDEIDKDLTIKAGFGYQPVFEMQIGYSETGLRLRPQRNEEARHMLKITGGTVTIEGVRFEMDAPNVGRDVPWKAIRVTGGNLRLLNCSISESNRRGMAAIVLDAPGEHVIKNSILVGGRAAVEVIANGVQDLLIDNSVLFSNVCVAVLNGEDDPQPANVTLRIALSTLQADDVLQFDRGDVGVESLLSIYKADWIGSSMLPLSSSREGRSWKGFGNYYNVKNWIGARGRRNPRVGDAKSFSEFWGGTDAEGSRDTVPFIVYRRNGAFNHGLDPQDWSISTNSELALSTRRVGMRPATVGPGEGYTRYREGFHYHDWKRGDNRPTLTFEVAAEN